MDTQHIESTARRVGLAVGVTFDPTAVDPRERWVCALGLDCYGAGASPATAIGAAICDLDGTATNLAS